MAAVERKPLQYTSPLTPSSFNHHSLRLAPACQSLGANKHHSLNGREHNKSDERHKGHGRFNSSATGNPTSSRLQDNGDRNTATRIDDMWRGDFQMSRRLTHANVAEESDDDFQSLKELSRRSRSWTASLEASKPERVLSHLKQPALSGARMQLDQTKLGLHKRRGNSQGQPMTLDDNEGDVADIRDAVEGTGDADAERVKRIARPHSTLAASGAACGSAESLDTYDPWWNAKEGYWIEDPILTSGLTEQQAAPSAATQSQRRSSTHSTTPLSDLINQQGTGNTIQSRSAESVPHSLPGDETRGTGNADARGIERDASPYSAPAASELASKQAKAVDAPRSKKLFDFDEVSHAYEPVPSLVSCEQRDQSHTIRPSSEPTQDETQIHQQDTKDIARSTSVALALNCHPESSDTNDDRCNDDGMAKLVVKVGLALVEQVKSPSDAAPGFLHRSRSVEASQDDIRSRQHSDPAGGRRQELRDASQHGTSDQGLEERQQREMGRVVEIVGEKEQQKKTLGGEVGDREMQQDEEQDFEGLIIGEQEDGEEDDFDDPTDEDYQYSASDDDDDDDDDDEDSRPEKRRKCVEHPCRTPPLPATQLEIDDAQSEADHGCRSTPIGDQYHHPSQTPRGPSATAESVLTAEYEEWPFHGFFKRARIGKETTYNLEFQLTHAPEHLELSGVAQALSRSIGPSGLHQTSHSSAAHPKTRQVKLRRSKKHVPWTKEEDETLVKMKEKDGCSWEEIAEALPSRTQGAMQVHYSTKLGGGTGSRKRGRPGTLLSTEVVS